MNHDNGHCLDCTDECPKDCWRAEMTRELKDRPDLLGVPLTWAHFRGTDECPERRGTCSDIISDLSDSQERINGLRAEARELRLRATRTTSRTDEPAGDRKRHGAPSSWDKLAEVEERLLVEERRRDELEQEAADAFEQMDSVRKTQILRLRWLYGLPLEQIADRLCWSESTVRHDAAEAMEDLKRLERRQHG